MGGSFPPSGGRSPTRADCCARTTALRRVHSHAWLPVLPSSNSRSAAVEEGRRQHLNTSTASQSRLQPPPGEGAAPVPSERGQGSTERSGGVGSTPPPTALGNGLLEGGCRPGTHGRPLCAWSGTRCCRCPEWHHVTPCGYIYVPCGYIYVLSGEWCNEQPGDVCGWLGQEGEDDREWGRPPRRYRPVATRDIGCPCTCSVACDAIRRQQRPRPYRAVPLPPAE